MSVTDLPDTPTPIEVLLVEDDPGDVLMTQEAFEEHKVRNNLAVVNDGIDAIAIRPMANLCLSWDHRALDGALAAQFLATLRGLIEATG